MTVETLNKNSNFYEDLLKNRVIYLDNPFSPKHSDAILIKERQINKKPEEIDYNLIYMNLLGLQRKEKEPKEQEIGKFDKEFTKDSVSNDHEFCAKISKQFHFINNYEFEEICYLFKPNNEINK